MCGKSFIKNLKPIVETHILSAVPVYLFDQNQDPKMPCIVLGYDGESASFMGFNHGHYTVNAYTIIVTNGYDDPFQESQESLIQKLVDLFTTKSALSGMNKATGIDTRPVSGFHMNALALKQIDGEFDNNSNLIKINIDAYCVAFDG